MTNYNLNSMTIFNFLLYKSLSQLFVMNLRIAKNKKSNFAKCVQYTTAH